jgi:capsular polysaccharide biosynthesis protein
VSIRDPVAEARIIMGEETVRRPEPVNLKPGDEALFTHEYMRRLGTAQVRSLRDVSVLPNGFLLSGGRLLSESFGGKPRGMYALRLKASFVKNVFHARRKVLVDDALFITDEFSNGFFHWICDVLPRLEAIDDGELSGRTIVIPAMADYPYVGESLAAYGEVQRCFLARSQRAQCAKLLAVSAAAPTGNYRPSLMASLRDRFRSHFHVTPGKRKIYISRSGARLRRISNEKDLLSTLERHGFETVRSETFSFAEQVSLIGAAEILVSNHGAGLTNMAWMLPETRVLELRSAGDRQNNCYYSLAAALGIGYYYQLCAPAREGQSTHRADIVVDVAEFEKQLAAISRPEGRPQE